MKILGGSFGVFVFALLLSACGGSVERAQGSGGSGAGGAGGSGAGGSGGAVGGSGGAVTGGSGGVGGAISCDQTFDGFHVEIQNDFDPSPTCPVNGAGGPESTAWEATGEVVKSATNTVVLDTCPPNADCMASFTTLDVKANGIAMQIPTGAFVHVRYELLPAWMGCNERVTIENVPSWGGLANPVSSGQELYLVGTDGTSEAPDDVPFTVSSEPLGCFPGAPSQGQSAPENYVLIFEAAGQSTPVPMGQTAVVNVESQVLTVRNQRSFVSGNYDDYWDWSWWATTTLFDAM